MRADTMRRVHSPNSSLITDHGHVAKENYTRYKYVLNLPGSTSGSYSPRNLNHLWFLGSVVLFWKARFTERYFPALTEGATHLTVDSSTLALAVRMLEENPKDAKVLREKASDVDHRIMCPFLFSCLCVGGD